MKNKQNPQVKYSYLNDPRALAEIRKHKWYQSQKAGREIGFATAALDWIENYGLEWRNIYASEFKDSAVFFEKRKYRRFGFEGVVELIEKERLFFGEGVNINLFGILCRTSKCVAVGSEVGGVLNLEKDAQKVLKFKGTVDRVSPLKSRRYELFLKFDNSSQEKLANIVKS